MELTIEQMKERIAFLEAGRAERRASRKANRTEYFKISRSRTWRGKGKGVVVAASAPLSKTEYTTKILADRCGFSKRNGKRAWRGE